MLAYGEDFCESSKRAPDADVAISKERQTLPEIGMHIVNLLEKSINVQQDTAAALGKTMDTPACPVGVNCLNECLNYILVLAESNLSFARLVHDSLI